VGRSPFGRPPREGAHVACPLGDLTTLEVLAILAVLESADQRVNGAIAPVLRLVRDDQDG
jgi:hypothetical protein